MKYDFTTVYDRRGMDALAVDALGQPGGFAPGKPKDGFSVIPMWVADMDFPCAPGILEALRKRLEHTFFLVPGYGAQGGTAEDVQYAFDKLGHGAAIMAGRSVLYAWQRQDDGADHYQQYAREAALKMREQILGYISVL